MEENTQNVEEALDRELGVDELVELFSERRFSVIRELLSPMEAPDIAELLWQMPENYFAGLFRILTKEVAAEVFVELDTDSQRRLIESFTDKELSEILSELYMDDTVDLIEEMPAFVVKRILRNSTKADRETINNLS